MPLRSIISIEGRSEQSQPLPAALRGFMAALALVVVLVFVFLFIEDETLIETLPSQSIGKSSLRRRAELKLSEKIIEREIQIRANETSGAPTNTSFPVRKRKIERLPSLAAYAANEVAALPHAEEFTPSERSHRGIVLFTMQNNHPKMEMIWRRSLLQKVAWAKAQNFALVNTPFQHIVDRWIWDHQKAPKAHAERVFTRGIEQSVWEAIPPMALLDFDTIFVDDEDMWPKESVCNASCSLFLMPEGYMRLYDLYRQRIMDLPIDLHLPAIIPHRFAFYRNLLTLMQETIVDAWIYAVREKIYFISLDEEHITDVIGQAERNFKDIVLASWQPCLNLLSDEAFFVRNTPRARLFIQRVLDLRTAHELTFDTYFTPFHFLYNADPSLAAQVHFGAVGAFNAPCKSTVCAEVKSIGDDDDDESEKDDVHERARNTTADEHGTMACGVIVGSACNFALLDQHSGLDILQQKLYDHNVYVSCNNCPAHENDNKLMSKVHSPLPHSPKSLNEIVLATATSTGSHVEAASKSCRAVADELGVPLSVVAHGGYLLPNGANTSQPQSAAYGDVDRTAYSPEGGLVFGDDGGWTTLAVARAAVESRLVNGGAPSSNVAVLVTDVRSATSPTFASTLKGALSSASGSKLIMPADDECNFPWILQVHPSTVSLLIRVADSFLHRKERVKLRAKLGLFNILGGRMSDETHNASEALCHLIHRSVDLKDVVFDSVQANAPA